MLTLSSSRGLNLKNDWIYSSSVPCQDIVNWSKPLTLQYKMFYQGKVLARKWGLIYPKALLHFPKLGDTASAKASPLPPKPGCIPQNLSGAGMTRGEMETEVTRNASPPRAPSAVPSGCPWREHISNTQLYPWWETPQRFTGKISASSIYWGLTRAADNDGHQRSKVCPNYLQ